MWPIIAGRRIALNFRWAQPDGVLELYQAGSEGPQWWHQFPDTVRGLPPAGILDRCKATKTCPKIIEHFGSAEVWALKLTPEWVGTDGKNDIPTAEERAPLLHRRARTHGGGAGGFNTSLHADAGSRTARATTRHTASCRPTRCRTRRRSMRCACTSATG